MGASNIELVFISTTWDFTTFHNFLPMFKKKIQKLAGLWLAGEVVNHVGIYGSKAAEGLSAFQRRSCLVLLHGSKATFMPYHGLCIHSYGINRVAMAVNQCRCLTNQFPGCMPHCTFEYYDDVISLKAGRGISVKTCGLDDVFLPDDLGYGPCTPFFIYMPYIIAAFLLLKYTRSKRHTNQKLVWPCWCIGWFDTVWFQVCFQLYVPVLSMSWYGYRYLWHCTLVSSTPWLYSQSDWFLGVRCSIAECHQVLLSLFPR